MINNFHGPLEQLRIMKTNNNPAVSIFIPLKSAYSTPCKIFTSLVKAADNLLTKDGYPKLNLHTPDWDLWLRQGTVTLGVFYHNGISHLTPLSTKMQPRVIVADSFHVKPIIGASHEYVDALLVHFNESGASLFRVHPAGETLLDTYVPSGFVSKSDWPNHLGKETLLEYLEFLQNEVRGYIRDSTRFVGITDSGQSKLLSEIFWKKVKLPIYFFKDSFNMTIPQNSFSLARLRLLQNINDTHTRSVMNALKENNSNQDQGLEHLVQKILRREIKNLCVSLDCMHFGKIEPSTGEIIISKAQKDSKDDDLLDDLLELALERGIKVSVVPRKFLPEGHSFVAS